MRSNKKYKVYCKTGNRANRSAIIRVWRVNDLMKFVRFLDQSHSNWTWFNVWDLATGKQIASYTKNDRPNNKKVTPGTPVIRPSG